MRGWLFGNKDPGDDRNDQGTGTLPDSGSGTNSTAGGTGGYDGADPGPGSERGGRQGMPGSTRAVQS